MNFYFISQHNIIEITLADYIYMSQEILASGLLLESYHIALFLGQ